MHVTRRVWAVGGLAAFLAALSVALARPAPLAGTALLGAWLLGRQYLFVREVGRTVDALSVAQVPAQTGVRTGADAPVTLSATLEFPAGVALSLEAGLPTATSADDLSVRIDPGESGGEETVDVRWPVAGTHRFEPTTLRVTDGLFAETLPVGTAPTVTVEPRSPRTLHVGAGGERLATAYGEHGGGQLGSGIDPSEVREYVPGDTADRIDWKATARLGSPHVREHEPDTDRRTLLVVDHRASLVAGEPGETKLEYLREVALSIAGTARTLGDPLGLLAVDDEGVTTRLEPSTAPDRYTAVRRRLLDLEATAATTPSTDPNREPSAATVRRSLAALEDDADPFAATLRPFYAGHRTYRERLETNPLYGALRTTLTGRRGTVWTVLCTDDTRPDELRETVDVARSGGGSVLVLLAPSVLYEPGELADLEGAYDRYLAFEERRRELARLPRVTALEVGPGDRLSTVLTAGRDRRLQRAGGRP
ncbi:DUF58 domain-containing protein [Natrononativus amylolyticus]|uniref:DUF58 domain-containing protein n=1 Tax=Natrononativus amylolyticus TaxID=2963434 RepID=UPI0020CE118F|nr:DUF58 domain-containing protein [Natrononativus amylolyticus]